MDVLRTFTITNDSIYRSIAKNCILRMRTKLYRDRTNIVATLDKLHTRHALPGFADRTAEEKEIEKLTTDITKVCL